MAVQIKASHGYNGSSIRYVSQDEVAWICGNVIVLQSLITSQQRILRGTSFGIQTFGVCLKSKKIAFAEKGLNPRIQIYNTENLYHVKTLSLGSDLGYTALSFSPSGDRLVVCSDEPHLQIDVLDWQKEEKIVSSTLKKPAYQVTFHPTNPDLLCTSGHGYQVIWQVEKIWDKIGLVGREVKIPGSEPCCHAWSPQGLYSGTLAGEVTIINTLTREPLLQETPDGPVPAIFKVNTWLQEEKEYKMSVDGSKRENQGLTTAPADAIFSASVSTIRITRQAVIVGTSNGAVFWLSHASADQGIQVKRMERFSEVGVSSLAVGGEAFGTLVVGTQDAILQVLEMGEPTFRPSTLVSGHIGPISGAAAHADGQCLLTTGLDGTLRVWAASTCRPLGRRTFSSPLTSLAASPTRLLAAVGSDTGVVRVVSTAPERGLLSAGLDNKNYPLRVTFRARLHSQPVAAVAISPRSDLLASLGKDNVLWFVALSPDGSGLPLGCAMTPEPALAIAWAPGVVSDGDAGLLVSLTSGALMMVSPPFELARLMVPALDYQLGPREMTTKTIRVEVPLLRMQCLPNESNVEVLGLGADRQLHRISLPTEGQAWAGSKGRMHKSAIKVDGHAKCEGDICIARSGGLVVTVSADGTIGSRTAGLLLVGSIDEVGMHDASMGGSAAVSFDAEGRHVISAGADGALFILLMSTNVQISLPPPVEMPPTTPIMQLDRDNFDDSAEATEVEAYKRRMADAAASAMAPVREAVNMQLMSLRTRLTNLLHRNEAAPELERIERSQFIINHELKSELYLASDERVEAVREAVRVEQYGLEIVVQRLKEMCMNSLLVRSEVIEGMKSSLSVTNYALPQRNDTVLKKVSFLRRVEMAEHRTLGVESNMVQFKASTDEQTTTNASPSTPQDEDDGNLASVHEHISGIEGLGYSDFDVSHITRKAFQAELYKHKVYDMKAKFNEDFTRIARQRFTDADRITDLLARLEDIGGDLKRLGVTPAPYEGSSMKPGLDPLEQVLSVNDSEVPITKYIREEEKTRLEAVRKAEEEAAKRNRGDNASERALRQMMGGHLENQEQETAEWVLVKPEWMDGPPKAFTDEQMKEFKDFLAKEKQLQEEKAKKVATLEMELRTVRAAIEDTADKFDATLVSLSARKLKAAAEIASMEMRLILLAVNLDQCLATSDKAEKAIYNKLAVLKEQRQRLAQELSDKRIALQDMTDRSATLAAEERQLDRGFKKEFSEAEALFPRLQQLYRYRLHPQQQPAAAPAATTAVSMKPKRPSEAPPPFQEQVSFASTANTSVEPAATEPQDLNDPFADEGAVHQNEEPEILDNSMRPEGIDQALWDHFVIYRANRVHVETELRGANGRLLTLKGEVPEIESAESAAGTAVEELVAAMSQFRKDRRIALHNSDLQLRLKLGQVETEPIGLSSDMSHATFIHCSMVDRLNSQVRQHGGKKGDILMAIKEFKKGIYQLEWEHKKCDMMISDLIEKTRELQLLHVTRDVQNILKNGEDRRDAQEAASTENLLRNRERLHAKALIERQQKLRRISDQMQARFQANEGIRGHMTELKSLLEDQERLKGSMMGADEVNARRMRNLVTNKKLNDIARAQLEEINLLRKELDAVRKRTFPNFMQPAIPKIPPDIRVPL